MSKWNRLSNVKGWMRPHGRVLGNSIFQFKRVVRHHLAGRKAGVDNGHRYPGKAVKWALERLVEVVGGSHVHVKPGGPGLPCDPATFSR